MYMFTLVKTAALPVLSLVKGNPKCQQGPDAPRVTHTKCGAIVQEEVDKMQSLRPDHVKIIKTVIMPDHIHLLLRILQPLKQPVTHILGAMKSAVTSRMREEGLLGANETGFEKGINDSIVYGRTRMDVLFNYIADNPRRLLIKRAYPNLFSRRTSVRAGEYLLDCVGNLFLLRRPLLAVHVRRKWNEPERNDYKNACLKEAAHGTVLISPFIHPVEKEIMREAMETGGCVIRLTDRGFTERWKPSGVEFNLCGEGRMLFMAESDSPLNPTEMHYGKATRMNTIAEYLASSSDIEMAIRRVGE